MKILTVSLLISLGIMGCAQPKKSDLGSVNSDTLPELGLHEQLAEDLRAASQKVWNTTISIHESKKQTGFPFGTSPFFEIFALNDQKLPADRKNMRIIGTVLVREDGGVNDENISIVNLFEANLLEDWKEALKSQKYLTSLREIKEQRWVGGLKRESFFESFEMTVRIVTPGQSWPYTKAAPPKVPKETKEQAANPSSGLKTSSNTSTNSATSSAQVPDAFESKLRATISNCKSFEAEMTAPTVYRKVHASTCLGMEKVDFNDSTATRAEAKKQNVALIKIFLTDFVPPNWKQNSEVEALVRTLNAAYDVFK